MGNWIAPIERGDLAQWRIARRNRRWPTPNTLRAFGGFWFPRIEQEPAPICSHFLVRFDYRDDEQDILWVDHLCEPSGLFECYSDSGINERGQRLQMFIRDTDVPSGAGDTGGVEWEFVYDRDGFADTVRATLFWPQGGSNFASSVPFDGDHPHPQAGGTIARWNVDGEDGDTDWLVSSQFAGLNLIFFAAPERYRAPVSS